MNLTRELLKTICLRGENLEKETRLDNILNSCLRSSINGFDFTSFRYNEKDEEEVKEMNFISEKLKKLGFEVYFDGDEGHMHMYVSWD
ncbi:hypothetical protein bcgnr5390_12770 [Bacillus luti]|nr:hypothetical protein BC2903_51450 [Bacillus cereus]